MIVYVESSKEQTQKSYENEPVSLVRSQGQYTKIVFINDINVQLEMEI